MERFLEVSSLSIKFGGIQALKDVSLSLQKGSFLGVMGPNGGGKTTLINCLSRVYTPNEGQMLFEGCDLRSMSGDQLVKLGISRTFQDLNFFSLIPDMMVIDYVRLGQFSTNANSVWKDGLQVASSRKREWETKRKARRILEFFRELRESMEPPQVDRGYPWIHGREGFADLIDMEYQPIGGLSFAWRRRLDLVRALVSDPRLLLLDEPAQGLAPSEIDNLGEVFKKVRVEFGVSALIVEHNMPLLLEISDKIIVMDSGEIIAAGLPLEVQKNSKVIEIYLGKPKVIEVIKVEEKPENTKTLNPILTVENLDVYYGGAQALFGVNLELFPNQIASVLGTNGSGKSTILRTIGGVEKPAFGEIRVNGKYLPPGWPELAAQMDIQYVPQGHVVFPELSILDNLRVGGYLKSKSRGYKFDQELERVLHFFPQLRNHLKVEATKLSGGQQQMLAIGQAIMARPQVLLLDEPSLGLTPSYVDNIFTIIKQIAVEEGCSVLLVEQNVAKALEISDYIFLINTGSIIGKGTSRQFASDMSLISKKLGFL